MYKKKCMDVSCNFNLDKICLSMNKPDTCVSYGTLEKKKSGVSKGVDGVDVLTKREIEAFKHYNKVDPKLTLSSIGDLMGITKQRVDVLVRSAKKKLNLGVDGKGMPLTKCKGGVDVSDFKKRHRIDFHAEEITFDIEPLCFINEKMSKLKHTEYKSINTDLYHVKIFSETVKVNFKRDISGFEVDRILLDADRRVINFIKNFNFFLKRNKIRGKVVLKDKGRFLRVKRHWAILGTGLAKDLKNRKEDLFVYDRDDGVLRLHFDLSDPSGHIELTHKRKADSDAKPIKKVFDEYLHDDVYGPKETTDKVNTLMSNYVKSVEEITSALSWVAENNKSHRKVLGDMTNAIKELRKEISKKNMRGK